MKKIISILLLFTILLSIPASADYSDTVNHWANSEIAKWSDLGIIMGSEGSFKPDDHIIRGDTAIIIDRVMNYKSAVQNKFSDLSGEYYKEAVLRANKAGVIMGSDGLIRGSEKITRQEAVVMLSRAFGFSESEKPNFVFNDSDKIADWAKGYVNTMINKGYMRGDNNLLNPENNISRAEIVKLLDNIITKIYKEAGEYSDNITGTVIINTDDIILKNCKIDGDLIVSDGLFRSLDLINVEITGNLIVKSENKNVVKISSKDEDIKEEISDETTEKPVEEAPIYSGGGYNGGGNNLPKPEIITTLVDGAVQKGSKKTFDVWAKDVNGNKITAEVTLNNKPVPVNWDDTTKTSFTLTFTDENIGSNIISITATDDVGAAKTINYNIIHEKAIDGDIIGTAVWSFEAFTIGCGYIIEPKTYDIIEGETAAQMLNKILAEAGFGSAYTGTLQKAYYLSHIKGVNLTPEIPYVLADILPLDLDVYDPADYKADSLGEFDFTNGSGFMYCVNNIFPNVGFSDTYLSDNDVVRVQYTLAYGKDIGGYGALGAGDESEMYYPVANKDELTREIAKIGFDNCPADVKFITQMVDAGESQIKSALLSLR